MRQDARPQPTVADISSLQILLFSQYLRYVVPYEGNVEYKCQCFGYIRSSLEAVDVHHAGSTHMYATPNTRDCSNGVTTIPNPLPVNLSKPRTKLTFWLL